MLDVFFPVIDVQEHDIPETNYCENGNVRDYKEKIIDMLVIELITLHRIVSYAEDKVTTTQK